ELQHALDLPIRLENDINLAALGEQWRGGAPGGDDFVFLSIGTGGGGGGVLGGGPPRRRPRRAAGARVAPVALRGGGPPRAPRRGSRNLGRRFSAARRTRGRSSAPPAKATKPRVQWLPRSPAGSRCTSRRSEPSQTSSWSSSEAASAPTATCCSTPSGSCWPTGFLSRPGSRSRPSAKPPC